VGPVAFGESESSRSAGENEGKVTPTSGRVETFDDTVDLLEVLRTGAVRGSFRRVPSAWFVLDNKVMLMEKRTTGPDGFRCLLAILQPLCCPQRILVKH
jgi:hypothetical protein